MIGDVMTAGGRIPLPMALVLGHEMDVINILKGFAKSFLAFGVGRCLGKGNGDW